jgi:hypothetical protein
MTTHETDQPHEVDHADENYGVDSEGDELAQEQAAEAEEAEPVGVDDALEDDVDDDADDDLDHTDPPFGADAGVHTEGLADPDADVADGAAAFGSPDTETADAEDLVDQPAIALGPIDDEHDEGEDEDDGLADEPVIVELEETEVEVLDEPEPVDDADATDADTDDESVLLTESEPGSVLPPEEPEEPEAPEAFDEPGVIEAGTSPVAEAPLPVPEPSPEALLEPVGAESPIDPGTGTHQERWSAIQGSFVDDPLRTVESAGSLVAEMLQDLERAIAEQRAAVDDAWDDGSSTDDLRAAFRSYRDMFRRVAALLTEAQPSG